MKLTDPFTEDLVVFVIATIFFFFALYFAVAFVTWQFPSFSWFWRGWLLVCVVTAAHKTFGDDEVKK